MGNRFEVTKRNSGRNKLIIQPSAMGIAEKLLDCECDIPG